VGRRGRQGDPQRLADELATRTTVTREVVLEFLERSRIKMELDSKPTELDQLDRQILQLEIERTSLAKEKDPASNQRLKLLEKELAELTHTLSLLKSRKLNLRIVMHIYI
jgi:hypothetical protein